jgi:hypothetical protein
MWECNKKTTKSKYVGIGHQYSLLCVEEVTFSPYCCTWFKSPFWYLENGKLFFNEIWILSSYAETRQKGCIFSGMLVGTRVYYLCRVFFPSLLCASLFRVFFGILWSVISLPSILYFGTQHWVRALGQEQSAK